MLVVSGRVRLAESPPVTSFTVTLIMQLLTLLAVMLAVLSLPLVILWRVTESREQRIKRIYQSGSISQKRLAQRFGVSTYMLRKILAAT